MHACRLTLSGTFSSWFSRNPNKKAFACRIPSKAALGAEVYASVSAGTRPAAASCGFFARLFGVCSRGLPFQIGMSIGSPVCPAGVGVPITQSPADMLGPFPPDEQVCVQVSCTHTFHSCSAPFTLLYYSLAPGLTPAVHTVPPSPPAPPSIPRSPRLPAAALFGLLAALGMAALACVVLLVMLAAERKQAAQHGRPHLQPLLPQSTDADPGHLRPDCGRSRERQGLPTDAAGAASIPSDMEAAPRLQPGGQDESAPPVLHASEGASDCCV